MDIKEVQALLMRHYKEAVGGVVDKTPSQLIPGGAAERDFYIMKIDLANSTELLARRNKSTYLKLAHTFLSSVDEIVRRYNADPAQTGYAGDGVTAYFPRESVDASHVLAAACYSRAAVICLTALDAIFNSIKLQCKVVLSGGGTGWPGEPTYCPAATASEPPEFSAIVFAGPPCAAH